MALLDRLLPAWRHSDPEVRADAISKLGRDSREILESAARSDGDARVRRIAIKKIDDAELLSEIARTDADPELQALAAARADELLIERAVSRRPLEDCTRALAALSRPSHRVMVALRAAHPEVRRAALAGLSDERPLAEIARRSDNPEIGLAALARVTDLTLLQRVAGGETRPEVALAALTRIEDPNMLHTIASDPQAQKSVRKRARAMLESTLTEDHPIRVAECQARQVQLCDRVAQLGEQPDPATARAALHQIESDWRELATRAVPAPEVEQRFRRAAAAAADAITRAEDRVAERHKHAAARLRAYEARLHLCETVESLEGPETPERLDAARAAWRALAASDDPRGHELAARFTLAVERCAQRHERWRVRDAFRAQLEALVIEAERLVETGAPHAAARPRAQLERRWIALASSPDGTKWMATERGLQRRFATAGAALHDQAQALHGERQQREREGRGTVKALCGRMEQLARADTLRRTVADRALAAAADTLGEFPPVPAAEREALRQRLTRAQRALEQRVEQHTAAEEWKRWANADVQQQLITRAEELLAAGDPRAMLRALGQLEQEWKTFATAPADQSHALWERFQHSRDELRRRCNAYLSDNLAKKEALCTAAEALADSTDWNATAAAIQRMQAEWKEIGPVRQALSAALFERFRAPANRFFERRKQALLVRKEQRDERLARMRTLCAGVEAVADSTDWEEAAAEIKRLQIEAQSVWGKRRAAGPSEPERKRQGDVLQQQFQAACDRFFERYRRRGDVELDAQLTTAETILGHLDALRAAITGADAPSPDDVTQRLRDHLGEWNRLGVVPPDHARRLQLRLQASCDAIEAACPDGLTADALAAESNAPQREKLCTRLERLVDSLAAGDDEPPPGNLAERLKLALAANTIGGPAATQHEQARREALENADRLREKWQRLGPIIGQRARVLARRFETAVAAVDQRRGSHAAAPQGKTNRPR